MNMTIMATWQVDDNKGILSITYNHLNLPEEIVFSQTKRINYLYAADGRKLKETITDGAMTHTFDYCSNLVYEDGELSYLLTPGGRAIPTEQEHEYVYEYFLKDHLGNVRVVFGDPDHVNEAEVIQENHYYPFGMTMGGLELYCRIREPLLIPGQRDHRRFWPLVAGLPCPPLRQSIRTLACDGPCDTICQPLHRNGE